jgi:mannan endo-1,4-beta-mannosidase
VEHHLADSDIDIKLIIAMHDRYQLGCWGNDSYVDKYHLPAVDCATGSASDNNVEFWYSDSNCISDFENRIRHILEHRNSRIDGSPAWKDLSSHIFSFNIQNEGQGHLNGNIAPHPTWWCDRATFMRSIMGESGVLISTGKIASNLVHQKYPMLTSSRRRQRISQL